jgi:hypothetical protein
MTAPMYYTINIMIVILEMAGAYELMMTEEVSSSNLHPEKSTEKYTSIFTLRRARAI